MWLFKVCVVSLLVMDVHCCLRTSAVSEPIGKQLIIIIIAVMFLIIKKAAHDVNVTY